MKKTIALLFILISFRGISFAQDNTSNDSSQVEFYSSMEDYISKNIISQVHITIMSVSQSTPIYTLDFKSMENIHTQSLFITPKKQTAASKQEAEIIIL